MDEDEKEMLNEARARLANTQGKKAKRKARERQLEEAKRLANLQKKRELKAAGLEHAIGRKRHKGGIDYAKEIPFRKDPPPGFFDTSEEKQREDERGQGSFQPTTIQELEGNKRKDIENKVLEQQKKRREVQEKHDVPTSVQKAEEAEEASLGSATYRGRLNLPPPQVSERELEDIAKIGKQSVSQSDSLPGSTPATSGLVGDYTPRQPDTSSARTPAEGQDPVLREAENISKLQAGQTPLAGGENPNVDLQDFSGITPQRQHVRTTLSSRHTI